MSGESFMSNRFTPENIRKDFARNRVLYAMAIPIIAYFVLFHYMPMYGVIIAFKRFSPAKGFSGSEWVGLTHFVSFFKSYYFWRLLRNTLLISLYSILWGFPAPVILALLINELRRAPFKRTVQSLTYIPHFVSQVVVAGMLIEFCQKTGLFNDLRAFLGLERISMLQRPGLFRTIYVGSEIWQEVGWGTIIYLAALAAIDPQLYEAATIDGAGRWKSMLSVTLPSIMPTVVILLIMRIGKIMTIGHETIILLYNPLTYETADVISTFVYRKGLLEFNWSYATAVGLFNSVLNFGFLLSANAISRKVNQTSLW